MKTLVTGSAGHLGEALMRVLRAQGQEAVGLDIKSSAFTDRVGDIADPRVAEEVMRGVGTVLHTATLHKPHLATHSKTRFLEVNTQGTLNLLEAAAGAAVGAFVFTSTTSVFGDALRPPPGQPAAWITEEVAPLPKNIYGASKLAAEHLCRVFARNHRMPCVILRTSRFFPEEDDDRTRRDAFAADNSKLNELLYRRADIADMVSAHLAAIREAPRLRFARFIISASSPFRPEDAAELGRDAPAVLRRYFPGYEALYGPRGWLMFERIDRVYDSGAARRELAWEPEFTFARGLADLEAGRELGSDLARLVGSKGYHGRSFADGPFPVEPDPGPLQAP
jgi:UDP-glucose 4-epimerase